MKPDYNPIAPFYDRLSKLVYGDAIVEAQKFLIASIPVSAKILIAGGGTGWILEEVSKVHFSGLDITYVDSSQRMIALSKKRNAANNVVSFINSDIMGAPLNKVFDVVITPFLFDNFSNRTAKILFDKIERSLSPSGFWLFSDFQVINNSRVWQKLLLKAMYLFFRTICKIEASRLPDINSLFDNCRYTTIASKTFFHNFILSVVYRRKMIIGQ